VVYYEDLELVTRKDLAKVESLNLAAAEGEGRRYAEY
jgi:hypothetical protein